MPLVLKSNTTQNEAGTELYIEVVDATGVYDVDDNPGGFGPPNPARNTLAIVFYGNHEKVDGPVLAVPTAHNPLTVSSFTILLDSTIKNGILNYTIFGLNVFNSGGVYTDGDVVYDNENPAAPFIKKRVAGVWEPKTAAEILGDEEAVQTEDNAFPIPAAIEFKDELNRARINKLREKVYEKPCAEEEYRQIREWFDYVDGELELATNDFCSGAYAEAEAKLESIFTLQEKIDGQY
jgi:hypothetical protein